MEDRQITDHQMMEEDPVTLAAAAAAADVTEILAYIRGLERDRSNLQQILLRRAEEHGAAMRALEREREQERRRWEREWREKEEALLKSMTSMIIGREELLRNIRSHQAMTLPLQNAKPRYSISEKELQEIRKLEERVREAERKEQQKRTLKRERESRRNMEKEQNVRKRLNSTP